MPEPLAETPLPPASFESLVNLLAVQTLAALGQLPEPGQTEPPVVRLEIARHFVDTLALLEGKTKGHLTPAEASLLASALSQLRLQIIEVGKK